MLRIAPGREGIGRIIRNQVDPWHGDAGAGCQPPHDPVQARRLALFDGLGTVGGQHDLVGEPVAREIHDDSEPESNDHSLLTTKGAPDEYQYGGEHGEQEPRLENVRHTQTLLRREELSARVSDDPWGVKSTGKCLDLGTHRRYTGPVS
jgi:hypothetical protein